MAARTWSETLVCAGTMLATETALCHDPVDPLTGDDVLPQQSNPHLRHGDRVRRVHSLLRIGGGVGFLPFVGDLKVGDRQGDRGGVLVRTGVHHHGCVHVVKRTTVPSMRIFPPPPSSAGVPSTFTVMPTSAATEASAEPGSHRGGRDDVVPASVAHLLGRASYSAQIAMVRSPSPAVAANAVGRLQIPGSTWKPPPGRASH